MFNGLIFAYSSLLSPNCIINNHWCWYRHSVTWQDWESPTNLVWSREVYLLLPSSTSIWHPSDSTVWAPAAMKSLRATALIRDDAVTSALSLSLHSRSLIIEDTREGHACKRTTKILIGSDNLLWPFGFERFDGSLSNFVQTHILTRQWIV